MKTLRASIPGRVKDQHIVVLVIIAVVLLFEAKLEFYWTVWLDSFSFLRPYIAFAPSHARDYTLFYVDYINV